MEFVNYTSFIQLAVAFNFAFACIEGFSPATLFTGLFKQVKETIKESYEILQNNCKTLSNKSLEYLSESNSIEKNVSIQLQNDTSSLITKIDIVIKKIDDRIEMYPIYFNKVCLILGLYSIFLLFIISDYSNNSLTNRIWPLFTIGIIGYIFILLIKEWLFFKKLIVFPLPNNVLRTTLITITLFVIPYLLIFLWDFILSNFLTFTSSVDMSNIRYISIFLPYFSFAMCFILHLFSIIYAKVKIYWMNVLIRRQEVKISQVLKDNKISGIQFN